MQFSIIYYTDTSPYNIPSICLLFGPMFYKHHHQKNIMQTYYMIPPFKIACLFFNFIN